MAALLKRVCQMVDMVQLSATARAVRQDRLTYLTPRKIRRLEKALRSVLLHDVPGDVAEFGVALGGSAIILAQTAGRHGRLFHGFDVFGMIPPPTSDLDDEKSKERYRRIASGRSSGLGGDVYYGYRDNLYDDVCRSFARYGLQVGEGEIGLHRGLFENTWPEAGIKQIAFAHIDCDWFDPVAYCLQSMAGCLSPGGVLVIDDYHDYGGCRAATDDFVRKRPEFHLEDGDNVILRRAI